MTRTQTPIVFLIFCLLIPATSIAGPNYASAIDAAEQPAYVFHGNKKSYKFHAPDCRYYNCKNCTVILRSLEEAREKKFSPCGVCKPQHYAWRHAENTGTKPEKGHTSQSKEPKVNTDPEPTKTHKPVATSKVSHKA